MNSGAAFLQTFLFLRRERGKLGAESGVKLRDVGQASYSTMMPSI